MRQIKTQRYIKMHELFISRATILFRYLVTYFNPKEKKIKEKISTKYSASSSLPFRLCLLSHFLLPNPTIVRTLALRKKLPPSSEAWVYLVFIEQTLALPWWLSGKESACQCRRRGFNPWSRKLSHASETLSPCATLLSLCPRVQEPQPLSLCSGIQELQLLSPHAAKACAPRAHAP